MEIVSNLLQFTLAWALHQSNRLGEGLDSEAVHLGLVTWGSRRPAHQTVEEGIASCNFCNLKREMHI